jgi:hypothetical protein
VAFDLLLTRHVLTASAAAVGIAGGAVALAITLGPAEIRHAAWSCLHLGT